MRPSLSTAFSRITLQASSPSSSSAPASSSIRFAASTGRRVPCSSSRCISTSRSNFAASVDAQIRKANHAAQFTLGSLRPAHPRKRAQRVGRGDGSGRGGTSGRGHKGQKARKGNGTPVPGFTGGQSPIFHTVPKRGFLNAFQHETVPLNIGRVQKWIDEGRLNPNAPITIKELLMSRCIHQTGEGGVKLLAGKSERLRQPIDIIVARASKSAIKAVESVEGGNITCKFYTPLSIRAAIKPEKWTDQGKLVPDDPLPIGRRDLMYYTDIQRRGYLAKMNRNGTLDSVLERLHGSGSDALLEASVFADMKDEDTLLYKLENDASSVVKHKEDIGKIVQAAYAQQEKLRRLRGQGPDELEEDELIEEEEVDEEEEEVVVDDERVTDAAADALAASPSIQKTQSSSSS